MVRTPDVNTGRVERQKWTAEQLLQPKNIGWLRARNAQGGGVYICPIDRRITLLDDLDIDHIKRLEHMNFAPATVVETSRDNFQGWIRLLPPEAPEPSREVATQASRSLTKAFGGDPAAVGAERFGRLPGFVNRKPKHDRAGKGPWVTLKAATGAIAAAGLSLISRIERALQAAAERLNAAACPEHEQKVRPVLVRPTKRPVVGSADADALVLAGLERSMSETSDQSVADFRACGFALKHGASAEAVAAALRQHSPDIEERHPATDDYIERTVRKAGLTDYVLRALTHENDLPTPDGP